MIKLITVFFRRLYHSDLKKELLSIYQNDMKIINPMDKFYIFFKNLSSIFLKMEPNNNFKTLMFDLRIDKNLHLDNPIRSSVIRIPIIFSLTFLLCFNSSLFSQTTATPFLGGTYTETIIVATDGDKGPKADMEFHCRTLLYFISNDHSFRAQSKSI